MSKEGSARDAALFAIGRWRINPARLDKPLKESFALYGLDSRDRALAMELAYGTVRNLIHIDHVLSHFIREKPRGVLEEVRDIMRLAAYQLMYLTRIPAHAAVDEAVWRAKKLKGPGMAGFVNAVLRALIRGKSTVGYPDVAADPVGYLSVKYSFPLWLAKRWLDRFGPEGAESLMAASNTPPPLTVRANVPGTSRDGLFEALKAGGISSRPARYAPDGLILTTGRQVSELPGYTEGRFSVQDEAAQLVSLLLAPKSGGTVLDACAAPGGKSAHLSSLMAGRGTIIAADIGLDKMRLLNQNRRRLGLKNVYPVILDASGALPVKGQFDGILIDAPCSALGVIRRRPEIKYSRTPSDITRLSALQGELIDNLAGYVRPGGALVFSTCSTEPEEGESVIEVFLNNNKGFRLDDPKGYLPEPARGLVAGPGFLRTYPHMHGVDGFFAARLIRS